MEKLTPRRQIIEGFHQPHDARFHPFDVFPQILSKNTRVSHHIDFSKQSRRADLWNTGMSISYEKETEAPKKKADRESEAMDKYITSLMD